MAVAVLAVVALVGGGILVALTVSDKAPAASTAATDAPKPTSIGIGTAIAITRADTGAAIATITFSEVAAVPEDCLDSQQPGTQTIALRAEIANTGAEVLGSPSDAEITTVDAAGITQPVVDGDLATRCRTTYPRGASAAAGRNTVHWLIFQVQPNPTALQYTPIVLAADATMEDLANAWVKPAPQSVTISLPTPLPGAAAGPAPTTEVEQSTTTTPVPTIAPSTSSARPAPASAAPAAGVGCDPSVDNWALDAAGGQLKCAYAGGPTPKWVNSAPFIGIRQPGSRCSYDDGVAESPSGQTLVCTGDRDSAVWTPGP